MGIFRFRFFYIKDEESLNVIVINSLLLAKENVSKNTNNKSLSFPIPILYYLILFQFNNMFEGNLESKVMLSPNSNIRISLLQFLQVICKQHHIDRTIRKNQFIVGIQDCDDSLM